ncbi:hypothetical protein [Pseudescherichia sp.]|uniref:hypothetical protein n=1 Tax=Pseudescherichia sp. TaxID=2055881 RepID=UPI00289759C5|nr:hypothetical protein [Pseudescherichia sp.]
MSMNVAKTRYALKRRIDNFFASGEEQRAARALIDAVAAQHQAWIFGGMLRDISLFGHDGFTSDIDIVFAGEREDLLHLLSRFHMEHFATNKLGGIRFRYCSLDFDIWCLSETWAFKENIIPLEDAQSLLHTTLMSWDAVLYDVHRGEILTPENYLQNLKRGYLELVLDATPNETGSVVKILRTIYNKRVKTLGPGLSEFLHKALPRYSYSALQHYELAHYDTSSFDDTEYDLLLNRLRETETGYSVDVTRLRTN